MLRIPPADATPPAREPRAKRQIVPLNDDEAEMIREMVIHEDDDAFVLDKPPGLATQGGTNTYQHLDRLLDGLVDEAGQKPKLVHRLDKDTSAAWSWSRAPRGRRGISPRPSPGAPRAKSIGR